MFPLGPLLTPNLAAMQGAGAAAWTPSTPATPLAAYYDASDITTLWKDTAGTSAVTADGDAVARIDDKSGNGNHAIQATAGSRPIYHTSGGKSWLTFDGVDDSLQVSGLITVTDGSGQHSAGAAVIFNSVSGTHSPIDADPVGSGGSRVSQMLRVDNPGATQTIAFNTTVTTFSDAGPSVSTATPYAFTERTSTATTEIFVNGASSGGGTAVSGTMQSGTTKLTLGNGANGANLYNGKWYAGAVYKGVLSDPDHTSFITWLTGKM